MLSCLMGMLEGSGWNSLRFRDAALAAGRVELGSDCGDGTGVDVGSGDGR